MAVFSYATGRKERFPLLLFRGLPPGNNMEKPFHKWGWIAAAVVGLMVTALQAVYPSLKAICLMPVCCVAIYWTFFEVAFSKEVFGRWFYIGRTAANDKRLWKLFGKKTETVVVVIKALLLVIPNLLYHLLK